MQDSETAMQLQPEGNVEVSDDGDRELWEGIALDASEEDALQGIENELSRWVLQVVMGSEQEQNAICCRKDSTLIQKRNSQSGGMKGPSAAYASAAAAPSCSDLHGDSMPSASVLTDKASYEDGNNMVTDSDSRGLRQRQSSSRRRSILLTPAE